jgi:hypothetical protein
LGHVAEALVLEAELVNGLLSVLFLYTLGSAFLREQSQVLMLLLIRRVLLAFTDFLEVVVAVAIVEYGALRNDSGLGVAS